VHKNRQFIEIQFAVMVLISASELHFEKSKNLIFRNRLGCRNGSYIVLYRHEEASGGESAFAT
jgi:hypothetical protein